MKLILIISLFSSLVFSKTFQASNKYQFNQNKDEQKDAKVIKEYPELKKFLFTPPENSFFIGLGLSPLGLMGSKYFMALSPLQIHWKTGILDWEILSVSLGRTFTSTEFAKSWNFSFRTAPKLKLFTLFDNVDLSIGGLFGIEGVQYPDVEVFFRSPNALPGGGAYQTKRPVKLSSTGTIFGGILSQSVRLKNGNIFQINEVFYKQSFDLKKNDKKWDRVPTTADLAAFNDPVIFAELEADTVMMIEFSYLY